MARIAILGWGSLIPELRGLPLASSWQSGGPVLKIEFSRISADGRLTLVIDRENGAEVTTQYAESARTEPEDAVCDLMSREGTSRDNICVCSKRNPETPSCNHPEILPVIRKWLDASPFDAVIWTDLQSNFKKKQGKRFSIDGALDYLDSLPPVCRAKARDYINKAPEQTQTKLRQHLREVGWDRTNELRKHPL